MDNVLLQLQTTIISALGSSYTVIYGDNFAPAKTDFPFVSIEPVSTLFRPNGTGGLRENRHVINITAKVQLVDFYDDSTNVTVQSHLQELVNIMEDRAANGTPASTSILGALSNDLSLGGTVHTMELGSIQYNTVDEGNGTYIRTATLTIETVQQLPLCIS